MSYTRAVDEYYAGRLIAARHMLDGLDDINAMILGVLVDARLDKTQDAIGRAKALLRRDDVSGETRVTAASLLAFLQTRAGDVNRAFIGICEAKALLCTIPIVSAAVESDLWLTEAVVQFAQKRLAESERSAWNAMYTDLDFQWRPPASALIGPTHITTTRARALVLIGLIRASQERYHEQYRFLREAVTVLRTAPSCDLYLISFLQASRSFYARDFGQVREIIELQLILCEPWPEDLVELRVEVRRSLAILQAINGESECAIASLRAAALESHSPPNKLLLTADEAFFSRQLPEPRVLRTTLLDACALADVIEWETIGASRYALHAFAQELSYVDPERAASYMANYEQLTAETNPLSGSGRRGDADALFSSGIVAIATGNHAVASLRLSAAFEIWRDIGFRWQATMTAIELAELTGSKSLVAYADREARNFPDSWLAGRARNLRCIAS